MPSPTAYGAAFDNPGFIDSCGRAPAKITHRPHTVPVTMAAAGCVGWIIAIQVVDIAERAFVR